MGGGKCGVKSQISHRVGLLEAAMDGHNNQAVWCPPTSITKDDDDDDDCDCDYR